jgi:hypothetical protein
MDYFNLAFTRIDAVHFDPFAAEHNYGLNFGEDVLASLRDDPAIKKIKEWNSPLTMLIFAKTLSSGLRIKNSIHHLMIR